MRIAYLTRVLKMNGLQTLNQYSQKLKSRNGTQKFGPFILMIFVNQVLYSGIQQLIFFLHVPLIIVILHRTICSERGRELQIVNEESKNCCNCHSYLLYLHCTGFSPMQNSQENQQQHNMQILGCVMLVELRVFKHYQIYIQSI